MAAVTFYRMALALPVVLPLVLWPFGMNVVTGTLALSLWFGGIPYVLFATVLFYCVGRIQRENEIRKLSYVSPLLFIPFQVTSWRLYSGEWDGFWVFSLFILIIGYAYVGIVNLFYVLVFKASAGNP